MQHADEQQRGEAGGGEVAEADDAGGNNGAAEGEAHPDTVGDDADHRANNEAYNRSGGEDGRDLLRAAPFALEKQREERRFCAEGAEQQRVKNGQLREGAGSDDRETLADRRHGAAIACSRSKRSPSIRTPNSQMASPSAAMPPRPRKAPEKPKRWATKTGGERAQGGTGPEGGEHDAQGHVGAAAAGHDLGRERRDGDAGQAHRETLEKLHRDHHPPGRADRGQAAAERRDGQHGRRAP